jgi:hypothetical protein
MFQDINIYNDLFSVVLDEVAAFVPESSRGVASYQLILRSGVSIDGLSLEVVNKIIDALSD